MLLNVGLPKPVLLKIAPDFPYALGLQQRLKAELCDWDGFDERNDAPAARK